MRDSRSNVEGDYYACAPYASTPFVSPTLRPSFDKRIAIQYNALQMIIITRLIWDDWNVNHIALHGVTQIDVEEVCRGNFLTRQTYHGRLMVIGPNASGNLLSVILAPEGNGQYYVVTARPAAKKERRIYRQTKGDSRP